MTKQTQNRQFQPRHHLQALILVWLLIAGSALLYLVFVFTNTWRPHIVVWLLTSMTVILAVAVAAILVAQRFWLRTRRIWAIAVFMLTVTPLVWLGSYIWHAAATAHNREDLRLGVPLKALAIWVGDWFEIESRWRHPRLTQGRHIELFDDGDIDDVEQLVADMDAHVECMCELLEQPVPDWRTAWVRGSIFGFHGRAIGLWAICNTDDNSSELTFLDRHEVAQIVSQMISIPTSSSRNPAPTNPTSR